MLPSDVELPTWCDPKAFEQACAALRASNDNRLARERIELEDVPVIAMVGLLLGAMQKSTPAVSSECVPFETGYYVTSSGYSGFTDAEALWRVSNLNVMFPKEPIVDVALLIPSNQETSPIMQVMIKKDSESFVLPEGAQDPASVGDTAVVAALQEVADEEEVERIKAVAGARPSKRPLPPPVTPGVSTIVKQAVSLGVLQKSDSWAVGRVVDVLSQERKQAHMPPSIDAMTDDSGGMFYEVYASGFCRLTVQAIKAIASVNKEFADDWCPVIRIGYLYEEGGSGKGWQGGVTRRTIGPKCNGVYVTVSSSKFAICENYRVKECQSSDITAPHLPEGRVAQCCLADTHVSRQLGMHTKRKDVPPLSLSYVHHRKKHASKRPAPY